MPQQRRLPSWIQAITHVCQRWRDVALNDPTLWAEPDFCHPLWATEMLKRSKKAHLTVLYNVGQTRSHYRWRIPTVLNDTLRQLDRVSSLSLAICTDYESHRSCLSQLKSQPAPVLQSLSLKDVDSSFPGPHGSLSSDFLQGSAPELRRLELDRIFLPWDSPLYDNLTELIITSLKKRPTMPQLLYALEKMANLQGLYLAHTLPTVNTDVTTPPDAIRFISLSKLSKLSVNDGVVHTANFLKNIVLSPSTSVHANCVSIRITENNFSCVISSLYSYAQLLCPANESGNLQGPESLLLSTTLSGRIIFQVLDKHEFISADHSLQEARLYLDFLMLGTRYREPVINSLCTILPMHNLRSVTVSQPSFAFSREMWATHFSNLSLLNTISLSGSTAGPFLDAIAPPTRIMKNSEGRKRTAGESSVVGALPALRVLHFDQVDFGRRREQVRKLGEFLSMRSEFEDAAIEKLYFQLCTHIYSEDIDSFKESVSFVDWDEHETVLTDDEMGEDD
jgi:hypothetical protein